ncbi:MAG: tRNA preQ1(34) S-adenosylmethionine ribosyltransferase-isomerase QueA, partial [Eubacteriales bacterium]
LLQRDASRLLVYNRKSGETAHRHFYDVLEYLNPGDVLVLNNTRVLPARLFGVKRGSERHVEFLLLNRLNATDWEVILKPGKKLKTGDFVDFAPSLSAEIKQKKEDGVVEVSFQYTGVFETILDELGQMPLPPYITEKLEDKTRYQTVYAKIDGSAAAPTAGLHFTPELLERIQQKGIKIAHILLHVGLGTFRPVKVDDIGEHIMHSEYFSVSPEAADTINAARAAGNRIIAVGTTSVRTLESATQDGKVIAQSGNTNIFIYPGYQFKMVDSLITNFHLPKSTLVMLVSAFAGREKTLELYKLAVEERYRFFSFGDAMMIL